jgi:hypothetical protein
MTRSGATLAGGLRTRVARQAAAFVVCALAVGVALATILPSATADARSTIDSYYGFDRTYNSALRLVRVDMGLKVTEKDDKTGYFVFDYKSTDTGNKVSSGSFEFIRSSESDGPIRVVLQLPQMPQYEEQVLINAYVRKLRQEYGDPPERPKPKAPPPPPAGDGGPDSGDAEAP